MFVVGVPDREAVVKTLPGAVNLPFVTVNVSVDPTAIVEETVILSKELRSNVGMPLVSLSVIPRSTETSPAVTKEEELVSNETGVPPTLTSAVK